MHYFLLRPVDPAFIGYCISQVELCGVCVVLIQAYNINGRNTYLAWILDFPHPPTFLMMIYVHFRMQNVGTSASRRHHQMRKCEYFHILHQFLLVHLVLTLALALSEVGIFARKNGKACVIEYR